MNDYVKIDDIINYERYDYLNIIIEDFTYLNYSFKDIVRVEFSINIPRYGMTYLEIPKQHVKCC